MTKITPRARAEADYYLSFTPSLYADLTEADYEEWFLHDSRGIPCGQDNIIRRAKHFYGIYVDAERFMYNEAPMFTLLELFRTSKPFRFLDECVGLERIQDDLVESFSHTGLEGYTWPGAHKLLSVGAPIQLLVGAFGEETVRGWVASCITYYWDRLGL